MAMKFRLGKKPKRADKRTLQFRKYATAVSPPASVDFYSKVTNWPMMGNDVYGDCTCAAAGHMVEEWTTYATVQKILSDAAILAAYNVVDGGVDQGADMLTVLNYWRQTGVGGDMINSFVEIAGGNAAETQQAVYCFGNAYIGLELPDEVVIGDLLLAPWTITYGAPNPNNGHCVPIVGYDASNVYVVTWGQLKAMSWAFYEKYSNEAYAVLSNDWLNASGVSPENFNLTQLQQDLTDITQNPPPNPPAPSSWWKAVVVAVIAIVAAFGVWWSGVWH